MTPAVLLRETAARFRAAGVPDPETDASLLLSFLIGQPPLALRLDTETALSDTVLESYAALAARREAREPLQYITGEAPFCGHLFFVDPRVLIPRPETEELCAWALERMPVSGPCRVLDLCCGSGCIGITLAAARPAWEITLSDCSSYDTQIFPTLCHTLLSLPFPNRKQTHTRFLNIIYSPLTFAFLAKFLP